MTPQDLLGRLGGLYSAVIADILDAHGFRDQCLDQSIRGLTPQSRVAGRVLTMKAQRVKEDPPEPYKLEMEAIDTASRGDVLLVDADFDTTCGFWGELLTTACLAKGIAGIVMSASTRDLWALDRLDFPVFGIGAHPADSKGRLDVSTIRQPIQIGTVRARTGDLILGDQDGVVIVPREIEAKIVSEAWNKVQGENTVRDELAAGAPVAEVFKRHGIL